MCGRHSLSSSQFPFLQSVFSVFISVVWIIFSDQGSLNFLITMSSASEQNDPTDHYGYIPSKTIAFIFLALFAVTTVAHTAQAIRSRMWFLLLTAVACGLLEILGWSGRLWSGYNPILDTPFQIQITCTIIAPTPLLAANFVIFGRIIRKLGAGYSRLRPKMYTIIFTSHDFVSLVLQGIGGGLAATADTQDGADKGGRIMLGGIVFQLAIIVVFAICMGEYLIRYHYNTALNGRVVIEDSKSTDTDDENVRGELTSNLKIMLLVLTFSTLVLFIRAVYRTAELADGWNGRIIHTQVYFNVLDGAMVILAIYVLNFFHPSRLLSSPSREAYQLNAAV